jgi:hypothetical protein
MTVLRLAGLLAVFAVASAPLAEADSMRCANQLASLGDRTFEVERKCGPPSEKSPLGYASDGRTELRLEEWVYGPSNGMYRILRLEGNRLVRIESRRL